jgi:hypothetical protein
MNYIYEISDDIGTTCQIKISIPFFKAYTSPTNSSWQVLTEGGLRYRSGSLNVLYVKSTANQFLRFLRGKEDHWEYGLQLYEFTDEYNLANSAGSGDLYQPWNLNLRPGPISWTLIE